MTPISDNKFSVISSSSFTRNGSPIEDTFIKILNGIGELSTEDAEKPPVHTEPLNVATVTLAEIYFKQDLKEQAIAIYKQLLEREPDNKEIAERLEFIKSSQVESIEKSLGEKKKVRRRRPRPGVKRKK